MLIPDQSLPEDIHQRINDFLDGIECTTLEDAEAEIVSWDSLDVTTNKRLNPDGAFRVYLEKATGHRYVCKNAEIVIALANLYEDFECVTPDCEAHVDEPGDLCGRCTAYLLSLPDGEVTHP